MTRLGGGHATVDALLEHLSRMGVRKGARYYLFTAVSLLRCVSAPLCDIEGCLGPAAVHTDGFPSTLSIIKFRIHSIFVFRKQTAPQSEMV